MKFPIELEMRGVGSEGDRFHNGTQRERNLRTFVVLLGRVFK